MEGSAWQGGFLLPGFGCGEPGSGLDESLGGFGEEEHEDGRDESFPGFFEEALAVGGDEDGDAVDELGADVGVGDLDQEVFDGFEEVHPHFEPDFEGLVVFFDAFFLGEETVEGFGRFAK